MVETANITNFTENYTGVRAFTRYVFEAAVEFDPITLPDGDYWVRAAVLGSTDPKEENAFWLITGRNNVTGSVGWWEDAGIVEPTDDPMDSTTPRTTTSDFSAQRSDGSGKVESRVGWRQVGITAKFPVEVCVDQVGWLIHPN